MDDAQAMGYRLAIVPGMLFQAVVGVCDQMLAALKTNKVHPVMPGDATVREVFARMGSAEWDVIRTKFRDTELASAAE